MAWLYLPDTVASSSESTPPSEAVEPYVTLSGKATQRPLSWRGWKSRPWIRLLSGTTLPPSTADRGAERWISSLRDSRASPSLRPESRKEPQTNDGSGTISRESFAKYAPDGSLVKMSRDLFGSDSTPYCGRLPKWGMMFRGELFELTKWEPPTGASESLSSPGWPNMSNWPTPKARDCKSADTPDTAAYQRKRSQGWSMNLNDSSVKWPTITATEGDKDAGRRRLQDRVLNEEAKNWPTPMATDDRLTPESNFPGLIGIAHTWPTPLARDYKDGAGQVKDRKDGKTREDRLGIAVGRSSLPGLQISTCGTECSPKHRRLSPAFVEWLMGLPSGWTVAKIGSGPAETAWSHYKQLLQSECSRIARVGP